MLYSFIKSSLFINRELFLFLNIDNSLLKVLIIIVLWLIFIIFITLEYAYYLLNDCLI